MITEARIKKKRLENQLKLEAKIQELEVVAWDYFISTVVQVLLLLL